MVERMQSSLFRFITVAYDFSMILFAWFLAFWFRFNLGNVPGNEIVEAFKFLPVVLFVQVFAFWFFGLYRGVWRFASIPDVIRILKSVISGVLIISLASFFLQHGADLPRSVPILYAIFLIGLLCVGRFGVRFLKNYRKFHHHSQKLTLIVGGGDGGEGIIRDLLRISPREYIPVGIVDDDPKKLGREIHGVRVLGRCQDIETIVRLKEIELVIIAIPSNSSADMRRMVKYCTAAKVPFRTLPSVRDIANGLVKLETLRDVSLEDLLGREVVDFDHTIVKERLENQVVMVTGGGGSIRSELCRQIASFHPKQLIILEHNEFSLYAINHELTSRFFGLNVALCLASVTDRAVVKNVFSKYQPTIVFHAAAYKHVPLLEQQISVAVKNNVIGTKIIAEESMKANVSHFILVSTDKAVRPTNIMGRTKRAAEVFCQSMNGHSNTKFITVRFGNVLGSSGSVIPLFKWQLAKGGPLTVTHPEITRYFMTIPEAVRLILQSYSLGNGGEIFVLDMGEPVKITYLAEQMIRLAGKEPNKDIKIEYVGLRPGEKMYEELFHSDDDVKQTAHQKIFHVNSSGIDSEAIQQYFSQIEKMIALSDITQLTELLNFQWEN